MPAQYQTPYGGYNPALAQGLPPEFSAEMFTNLQQANSDQTAGQVRQAQDQYARFPGYSAGYANTWRDIQRQGANNALRASSEAQLAGVKEGLTDRRSAEQRQFLSGESALERYLKAQLGNRELDEKTRQFDTEAQMHQFDTFMNALSGAMGAMAKGA